MQAFVESFRYGNYCGQNYTAGRYQPGTDATFDVAPVDAVDEACMWHDHAYERREFAQGDRDFVLRLEGLSRESLSPSGHAARIAATAFFSAKTLLNGTVPTGPTAMEIDSDVRDSYTGAQQAANNQAQHAVNGNQKRAGKKNVPSQSKLGSGLQPAKTMRRRARTTGAKGPGLAVAAQNPRSMVKPRIEREYETARMPGLTGLRMVGQDFLASVPIANIPAGTVLYRFEISPRLIAGRCRQESFLWTRFLFEELYVVCQGASSAFRDGVVIAVIDNDPEESFEGVAGDALIRKAEAHDGVCDMRVYEDGVAIALPVPRQNPYYMEDHNGDDIRDTRQGVLFLISKSQIDAAAAPMLLDVVYKVAFYVAELNEAHALPNSAGYIGWKQDFDDGAGTPGPLFVSDTVPTGQPGSLVGTGVELVLNSTVTAWNLRFDHKLIPVTSRFLVVAHMKGTTFTGNLNVAAVSGTCTITILTQAASAAQTTAIDVVIMESFVPAADDFSSYSIQVGSYATKTDAWLWVIPIAPGVSLPKTLKEQMSELQAEMAVLRKREQDVDLIAKRALAILEGEAKTGSGTKLDDMAADMIQRRALAEAHVFHRFHPDKV